MEVEERLLKSKYCFQFCPLKPPISLQIIQEFPFFLFSKGFLESSSLFYFIFFLQSSFKEPYLRFNPSSCRKTSFLPNSTGIVPPKVKTISSCTESKYRKKLYSWFGRYSQTPSFQSTKSISHKCFKFQVLNYTHWLKAMAPHSSVLAWSIPGTGEPGGCRLWGRTESGTTEVTQQQRQQQQLILDQMT